MYSANGRNDTSSKETHKEMKQESVTLAAGLFLAVAVSAQDKPGEADRSSDGSAAAAANGGFATDIYQQLAKEQPGDSLFFCPFSVSIALTMAAEGAVGETAQQMNKVLHLPGGSLMEIHRGQAALQRQFIPAAPPGSPCRRDHRPARETDGSQ